MREGTVTAFTRGVRGVVLVSALCGLLGAADASASQLQARSIDAAKPPRNPAALHPYDFSRIYPDGLHFRIIRNGEEIGFHKAWATRSGDVLTIENHTVMDTRVFLSLVRYRMEYKARSRWRNGRFLDFTADVEEQGEKRRISLRGKRDGLNLRVGDAARKLTGNVLPSPHWLSVYIEGAGLLHGVTGEIWNIAYDLDNSVLLKSASRKVEARKYTLVNSEVPASEWYDVQGRWLAMVFEAPDGSLVNYECVECGQARSITLSQLNSDGPPGPKGGNDDPRMVYSGSIE